MRVRVIASRTGRRVAAAVLVALLALFGAAPADADCRLALALGLDVSGSVDETEYVLQMNGLANALLRPEVQEALFAFPDAPVDLYVFKWAGPENQGRVAGWVTLDGPGTLAAVTDTLRRASRTPMAPSTGLGAALRYGAGALAQRPDCWRRTLDLSGDGKNNAGIRPRDVAAPGITVNGLVIGADPRNAADDRDPEGGELLAYYRAEVIRGPGAFVEVARGFADFEAAMARKLLKELKVLAIARNGD